MGDIYKSPVVTLPELQYAEEQKQEESKAGIVNTSSHGAAEEALKESTFLGGSAPDGKDAEMFE